MMIWTMVEAELVEWVGGWVQCSPMHLPAFAMALCSTAEVLAVD
jgi:hypothetical protein